MKMHNNLAQHLRRWGLKVEEKRGWQDRGRPFRFEPEAVVCHHTASSRTSGNFPSESVVTFGRSDLPGPLCQILLGRDGTCMVIAGGYANHAGLGGPRAGIPANMGNTYAYGIEAENNGVGERWGADQLNAYYRLCAALLDYMGTTDVSKVFGHKEWTSRKIDPAGINMHEFRQQVRQALSHGPSVVTLRLSRLQKGKRNNDVLRLKRRLAARGLFHGNMDNYYGAGLVKAVKLYQQQLGYRGDDADGIPGESSLMRLGFNVLNK